MISVDDERLAGAGDAEGRGQAMRPAGERGQRFRRFGEIMRLVEDPAFERERLIGADAIGVRTLCADGERLRARQLESHAFERAAGRQVSVFDRALVDLGGDGARVQSSRRQERPAAFASRGQHQRVRRPATADAPADALPPWRQPSAMNLSRWAR